MFYFLSKTLFYLAMPLTWIMACLLISLFIKNKISKKRYFIAGIILLLIFTNSFLANVGLREWEIPATAYDAIKEPYDVAIVLTGMTEGNKPLKDRIYFGPAVDRITNTLDLYKKGKVKNILISGGTSQIFKERSKQDHDESEQLAEFLKECGVPANKILVETESRNTRENAVNSAKILKEKFPDQKYLLVTSAFHMRRANDCFKKAGIVAKLFSADVQSNNNEFNLNGFLPREEALFKWYELIHEMVGYSVYKIMGYC